MLEFFIILVLLLVILIYLLGFHWVKAELCNRHISYGLGLGLATMVSLATLIIALWRAEVAFNRFYAYHHFEQVMALADLALQQGKAAQVQILLKEFRESGAERHAYQGVAKLRGALNALLSPQPAVQATPAP